MNWEAIAAIAEAIGGAAVIASLIYLALQIRQSRQLERAASIREKFGKGSDMLGYTALQPEKLDTIRRGVANFSDFSAEEIDVFNGWGAHCLVTVEQATYMHRDGLLPEASWKAFENFGLAIIRSPAGSMWWSKYSGAIGQEFVATLDDRTIRAPMDSVMNILCISKTMPRKPSQFRSTGSNRLNTAAVTFQHEPPGWNARHRGTWRWWIDGRLSRSGCQALGTYGVHGPQSWHEVEAVALLPHKAQGHSSLCHANSVYALTSYRRAA